ncbi:FecR family protein [Arenibacter sp. F26102]|uniref:FecR family protein n=1 Tax=Arenibacter sp. F26102 TaxID=2926416 RepID=UPI001FF1E607|nr:FecR family protein [Arenibacter sp. F26102]MCK0148103.1 FecR family protein [Arenibacter sp. F26102]
MDFRLIIKKINNTLTEEEGHIFDSWYKESKDHRSYFHKVENNYQKGIDLVDFKKGWAGVSSKINKKEKRYYIYKYAAAIVLLITAGTIWFGNKENIRANPPMDAVVIQKDSIQIGTDKATLTLDDGSEIVLEKGESIETDKASSNGEQLVYANGQKSPEKIIAKNILTIPRGGQFVLVLADGTKVWVNSETRLRYPVAFAVNKTREVELVYGEAYFDVSPSTEHNGSQFVLHTAGQRVVVLGTEFNIKAYNEDKYVSTTLVEGKVIVENGSESKNLRLGHQSTMDRDSKKIGISKVDVYNEVSWKNGLFSFKNRSLEDIMQVLVRWYDVDVVFQEKAVEELTFNGVFRKTLSLKEILDIIQNTNLVKYEINGKTIIMK